MGRETCDRIAVAKTTPLISNAIGIKEEREGMGGLAKRKEGEGPSY